MNTEIVLVLEREFPEPWTLEERVTQLHGLLAMLGLAIPKEAADDIISHVHETLTAVAAGRMTDVDEDTRSAVLRALAHWEGATEAVADSPMDLLAKLTGELEAGREGTPEPTPKKRRSR